MILIHLYIFTFIPIYHIYIHLYISYDFHSHGQNKVLNKFLNCGLSPTNIFAIIVPRFSDMVMVFIIPPKFLGPSQIV